MHQKHKNKLKIKKKKNMFPDYAQNLNESNMNKLKIMNTNRILFLVIKCNLLRIKLIKCKIEM